MKKIPSRGSAVLFALVAALSTAAMVAACGDDEAATGTTGAPDASTTDTATPPDPPPPPDDAAADGGAEEIADGGGEPPPIEDAGPDDDAGLDAGPACALLTPGAFSASKCASLLARLSGGTLTTTTYTLTSVTVGASPTACATTFKSLDHRGALVVNATSASTATFQFLDQYKPPGALVRPTSVRYDVTVSAAGTILTYTPATCAQKPAPATAGYGVSTAPGGKKVLILALPYGAGGSARYVYTEI